MPGRTDARCAAARGPATLCHALSLQRNGRVLRSLPSGRAASALLLSDDEMTTALAVTVSMASGLKSNFGTPVKPLHVDDHRRNPLKSFLSTVGPSHVPRSASSRVRGGDLWMWCVDLTRRGKSSRTPGARRCISTTRVCDRRN
ncbi:hypothetical protein DPM13_17820 [Paracoccus mutanolyticus]|uniref:Uncharacterized protein n=1 Tax=Paracoccus mutanolyticus TaxID=1499308 RepID=A0ABM6WU18_9RHOB|nr:hypothetical protein DPM13_17820 [Paracoccus mutanolyticus]